MKLQLSSIIINLNNFDSKPFSREMKSWSYLLPRLLLSLFFAAAITSKCWESEREMKKWGHTGQKLRMMLIACGHDNKCPTIVMRIYQNTHNNIQSSMTGNVNSSSQLAFLIYCSSFINKSMCAHVNCQVWWWRERMLK